MSASVRNRSRANDPARNEVGPAPIDDVSPALARAIGGLGRVLIALGVLLLLFAGFQLWGTGLAEARAQQGLEDEFAEQLAAEELATEEALVEAETQKPPVLVVPDPGQEATHQVPIAQATIMDPADPFDPPTIPEPGDPVGVIEIPAIGVRKAIVEGTSRDVLRSGPGHYRSTPLPGRSGNTAIAGHRTTHGAPFFDIDLLQPGDEIQVKTLDGTATYLVEAHDDGSGGEIGHLIVDPSEVGVIADKGDNRLTLTACHPKYSAKERIIVTATLVGDPADAATPEPVPAVEPIGNSPDPEGSEMVEGNKLGADDIVPPGPDATPGDALAFNEGSTSDPGLAVDMNGTKSTVAASLGWQPEYAPATALWAFATSMFALAGWCVGRLWRRFPAYAMTVPPFSLALYYCFANLEKFLPAV